MDTQTTNIRADWWHGFMNELAPERAELQVERDEHEAGNVSIHTMVDGRGSMSSYVLGREPAIALARALLNATELR